MKHTMKVLDVEQGSGEWLRARLGMVTGTRLKQVMGSNTVQEGLIYELIAEQLSGQADELYRTPAMQWGVDHEAEAVEAYEVFSGEKCQEVGFCISDDFPYLGLSPDRLIKKRGKYTGAVEVKCPSTKTFIKYMADGGVPKDYRWQVVNYFIVCQDLRWLDFVVYDPRIIDVERRLYVMRVTRADEQIQRDIAEALERLPQFRKWWREVYKQIK